MSTLTARQQTELNKAIALYLKPKLDSELLHQITHQLNITDDDLRLSTDNNILEKKWSTVIRLQKKILDLETQVSNLNEIIDSNSGFVNSDKKISNGTLIHTKINWLPSRTSHTLKAHKASVNALDIHPFLPELVAALNDGSFVVWDLLNLVQPQKIINAHTKAINDIAYSQTSLKLNSQSKGSILVATCSSDLNIKIWDASNNFELVRTLTGHSHTISSIKFEKNNPGHLYSSSRDGSIILWDVSNGWRLKSFVGHSDWVRSLDLTENGQYVISCSNDQSTRLSHGESGTGLSIMVGHSHVIEDCKFSPKVAWKYLDILAKNFISSEAVVDQEYEELGFKYCATASRDETIRIWLLPLPIIRPHRPPAPSANPSATCLLELKGHSSWVRSLQFHPGGKYLFSSSDDKTIKIWDLSAIEKLGVIKCIRTLTNGHDGFINCIKFPSPIFFSANSNSSTAKNTEENKKAEESGKITELKSSEEVQKTSKEKEKEKLNELDKSIRCLFASGGTDNTVCLWN